MATKPTVAQMRVLKLLENGAIMMRRGRTNISHRFWWATHPRGAIARLNLPVLTRKFVTRMEDEGLIELHIKRHHGFYQMPLAEAELTVAGRAAIEGGA